jgi:hypothetical protein
MEMVQEGEVMLQGCRGGQGWTWSKQKSSMGFKLDAVHKVFVKMAERKMFSNFGNIFGGLHSYII